MFFVVSGSVDEIREKSQVNFRLSKMKLLLFIPSYDFFVQHNMEKIERVVHKGSGTGELAFFFGLRHLGNPYCCYISTGVHKHVLHEFKFLFEHALIDCINYV